MEKITQIYHLKLSIGDYKPIVWLEKTKEFRNEPEGGKRCLRCFYLRLTESAKFAQSKGFSEIATTLAASKEKDANLINKIGTEIAKDFSLNYLIVSINPVSREKVKMFSIYSQNYCGCIYSLAQ